MMHKAWCNVEEMPYNFSRSSIKFRSHMGWKINDFNPIWVRLLGRSQLSNPSDLPWYDIISCYLLSAWALSGGCHRLPLMISHHCLQWWLGAVRNRTSASTMPASLLTHWGRDKMDADFQTTFSNAISWMKMHELRLRFHWSLFPKVQLTIFQHRFR